MSDYGDFVTERRIELKYTLRKFCLKFNYDAGNFSRMERGIFNPYSGDRLDKLCHDLELNIDQRLHLFELAKKELQPLQSKIQQLEKIIEALEEANGFCIAKTVNGDIIPSLISGVNLIDISLKCLSAQQKIKEIREGE